MLVICVRRKYVTLIYDLPGRGGVLDLPKNTNSDKAEFFSQYLHKSQRECINKLRSENKGKQIFSFNGERSAIPEIVC